MAVAVGLLGGASTGERSAAASFAAAAECATREAGVADVCGIARDLTSGHQKVSPGYIASVAAPLMLATGNPLGFDPDLGETAGLSPDKVAMIKVPLYTNPGAIVPPVEGIDPLRVELTLGNFLDSRNQD